MSEPHWVALDKVLEVAESALAATTPEAASERFFEAAKRKGATYLQTRLYRRPSSRLTSATHFAAGGLVKRISPPSWPGSAAFNYICFDCNPLLEAIRQNRTRYRFSDFAGHRDRAYADYWEALGEADIADALCATSYSGRDVIASLHLGFGEREIEPETARTIQMAGLMLTERLTEFADGPDNRLLRLSVRETDCLAYMADGKKDREIGDIMDVTEATVRFHIDNARRKLGARNRAEAVAKLAHRRML
jgi:DNA-binding CsgD family transcriptional regulator